MRALKLVPVSLVIVFLFLAGCAGGAPSPGPSGLALRAYDVTGASAVATILEDFDHGPPELQMSRRVDTWGDRIRDSRSDISVADAGGTGKAARFDFQATFDAPFAVQDIEKWRDSGLSFAAVVDLPAPGPGAQGIAFRMRPDGFSLAELYLVQDVGDTTRAAHLSVFSNEGEWKDWRIPFAAFQPTDPGPSVDFTKPLRLEVQVSWQDNWNAYHFRTAARAEAAVLLDSVGFWRPKAGEAGRTLEAFDDERDRMPFTIDLYGSSIWTDYSVSDTGVTRPNDGVKAQRLLLTREHGGSEGDFLALSGRLELTPAIADFHKAGQGLTVFLKAPISVPVAGAGAITFLVRSDIAAAGTLEVQDFENDRYYSAGFSLLGTWTRVRVPFQRLMAGEESLANAKKVSDRTGLILSFDLPAVEVERAAAAGTLQFIVALDSITLEP